jgi:hypothetical protein
MCWPSECGRAQRFSGLFSFLACIAFRRGFVVNSVDLFPRPPSAVIVRTGPVSPVPAARAGTPGSAGSGEFLLDSSLFPVLLDEGGSKHVAVNPGIHLGGGGDSEQITASGFCEPLCGDPSTHGGLRGTLFRLSTPRAGQQRIASTIAELTFDRNLIVPSLKLRRQPGAIAPIASHESDVRKTCALPPKSSPNWA